jgi:hypothetical protein
LKADLPVQKTIKADGGINSLDAAVKNALFLRRRKK